VRETILSVGGVGFSRIGHVTQGGDMNRRTHNIHERFLRHIWSKQYLTGGLQTADGKTLEVFDVGRLNSDGGPDFCNAKIKINGITYTGDVEIHRTVFEWLQHQHQEDPRYNKVILHVVLETTSSIPPTIVHSGRQVPILILGQFLSDSIQTIWQQAILDERAMKLSAIPCYNKNRNVPSEVLDRWLAKLAVERLELKLRRFDERLKQLAHEHRLTVHEWQRPYGTLPFEGEHNEIPLPLPELTQKDYSPKELWEQVLYEGVMEGLGYSKNRKPFLRLAENLTLKKIAHMGIPLSDTSLEALLFGTANLLPKGKNLDEKEARQYVQVLRKNWKEIRPHYLGEILHPADWQFFPTRPSNFPTIRLAAASLLAKEFLEGDLFRCVIQALKAPTSTAVRERTLIHIFKIETNDFWKHHYSFHKIASTTVTALGASRIREIIINAVLPIALLYSRIFKDKTVREGVFDLYQSLPASESNSVTRLMEQQLLKNRLSLKSVDRQQALIQLYRYYCAERRCFDCDLGKILFP
jgi:hypothetical protein